MLAAAILLAGFWVPAVASGSTPESEAAADAVPIPPFGFCALEIFKASGDAGGLVCVDLNRDGLLDLVYPDNSEGTLRLLLQRAPGEPVEEDELAGVTGGIVKPTLNEVQSDPRFRVEKFYTDKHISSVVAGDFDGDGRPDFAYYSDPPELEVVFQSEPWGARRAKFAIRDGLESPYALEVADLNGDGRDDLVLLGKGKTYVFRQKAAGGLAPPEELYSPAEEIVDLEIADLDGDDRPDFIYIDPGKEAAIHVQLQGSSGFGPSRAETLGPLRSWLVAPFRLPGETKPRPSLFSIERTSKRLKLHRWSTGAAREEPGGQVERGNLSPAQVVPFGSDGDPAKRRHLITDVDGDGRQDVVVSYPEVAQLRVVFQDAQGELARRSTYPTLAEVNSVAATDVDGDGTRDIVVGSVEEKALGVSFWRGGRLQFPATIHLEHEPLLVAAASRGERAGGETGRETEPGEVFVLRGESGEYHMDVMAGLSPSGGLEVAGTTSLALKSTPSELRLLDANGDGLTDALVVVPYASPTLLVRTGVAEATKFLEISREATAGFGQLSGIAAGALSIVSRSRFPPGGGFSRTEDASGAVSSSGAVGSAGDVFLACRRKYARALRLDASGRLSVVEQFSGRGAGADLRAAQMLQLDDDPALEVVLMDAAPREIDVLHRTAEGDYAREHSLKAPPLKLLRLEVEDMDRDGRDDLVLIGQQEVAVHYGGGVEGGFQEVLSYSVEKETDLGVPQDLTVGDLNMDGWLDVVLSTAPRYNLLALSLPAGILSGDRPDSGTSSAVSAAALEMQLAFPVFEEKSYMRRGSGHGPRQMTVADIDGDGLDDLVLLIHDRILVYLQDVVPAPTVSEDTAPEDTAPEDDVPEEAALEDVAPGDADSGEIPCSGGLKSEEAMP